MAIVGMIRGFGLLANHIKPIRFYSSALFVSGKKANESYAVLTPSLDFDERFSDISKLSRELESRGIQLDLDNMKKKWDFYKEMDTNRSTLEQKRVDIAHQIKIMSKKTEQSKDDENEINRLKTLGKIIREDLKIVKEALWELEESVIPQALKLPNVLNKETPITDPKVLYSYGNRNPTSSKSHMVIGKDLGLLEYSSPMSYYLCGDAALFELAVLRLSGLILSENNIVRVTGLDFSRGIIVEGSGLDHEDYRDSFTLRDNEEIEKHSSNRMHLVGGASLQSFLAMHTKQLINPNNFPLRYFAIGRQYSPFSDDLKENGLFTVCQSSAVQVFVLLNKSSIDDDCAVEFNQIVNSMKIVYESISSHYKIVVRPARELKPWESLRVSFEMWSPYLTDYVEVGHLSMCGEYFSKRLLIGCQTPNGRTFPSVISGTVLSVPRLLGCLMEADPIKLLISDKVREHMPI